jgi:hypothetical protein
VHWQFYDNSKQRRLARARAYRWLARKLGVPESECHFGMFGVPESECHFGMFGERQCRLAIQVCRSEAPPPCEP